MVGGLAGGGGEGRPEILGRSQEEALHAGHCGPPVWPVGDAGLRLARCTLCVEERVGERLQG
jgi:hypothetical protein